jgi:hypothetical protein
MTFIKAIINRLKALPTSTNILLSLCAVGLLSIIGVLINYFPGGNDLFDNHYLAMAINFRDIKSLYDGFFPIGYSLLLKFLVGSHYPAIAAFYVNVLLTMTMMIVMAGYLKRQNLHFLFPFWLFLFLFFPQAFRYLITPGPDAAAMALFTIGIILQLARCNTNDNNCQSENEGTARLAPTILCVWGGMAMGAAALMRYHALPASIFFLLALFIFMKKNRKLTIVSGIVVIVFYLPQMAINVLSGHGPLETYHTLNLYNLVYGVNWYHMEKIIPLPSAKSIIFGAPFLFIKHYLKGVMELGVFAVPPLIYGFFASPEKKNYGYCIGAFCALYALFFGISASPRAVLLIIPISLLFFLKILFAPALPTRTKNIAVVITLLCGCLFLFKDVRRIAFCKHTNATYQNMETFFIQHGITNAQEVYTCDHNQYFKSLFPYRPLFNGGWGRIATYKYSEFYPELAVRSIDSFYVDCVRHSVRYVVFNEDAAKLADFCQGLYDGTLSDARFETVLTAGKNKVLRVAQAR